MEHSASKSSPRDVFLYVLVIGTLYISVWRFIDLLFDYIDVLFPDALRHGYYGDFSWSIRMSISTLIVIFPVYIGVTWFLRKDAINHPEKCELRVRKWLLNFTLFLAAATGIADLITLINNFLSGELTTPFVLKVFVVFLVSGGVFAYYFWDLRRETLPTSKPSKALARIVSAVVGVSIISSFFIIGSPFTQRNRRFDEQRVNDLQNLQGQIVEHWRAKSGLPVSLDNLRDEISGFTPPVDPISGTSYEYRVTGDRSFELCANFALEASKESQRKFGYQKPPSPFGGEVWTHEAGRFCFSRTIDPQLYAPYQIEPPRPRFD